MEGAPFEHSFMRNGQDQIRKNFQTNDLNFPFRSIKDEDVSIQVSQEFGGEKNSSQKHNIEEYMMIQEYAMKNHGNALTEFHIKSMNGETIKNPLSDLITGNLTTINDKHGVRGSLIDKQLQQSCFLNTNNEKYQSNPTSLLQLNQEDSIILGNKTSNRCLSPINNEQQKSMEDSMLINNKHDEPHTKGVLESFPMHSSQVIAYSSNSKLPQNDNEVIRVQINSLNGAQMESCLKIEPKTQPLIKEKEDNGKPMKGFLFWNKVNFIKRRFVATLIRKVPSARFKHLKRQQFMIINDSSADYGYYIHKNPLIFSEVKIQN